jgi:hypothetical protein
MAVRRSLAFAVAAGAAVILAIAADAPRATSARSTASGARRTTELAAVIASANARVLAARATAALAHSGVRPAGECTGERRDESQAAQDWLDDYAGGIENVSPLDDEQRNQLRTAKVRHQASFERELGEAQLDRPVLTADERARAYAIVNEAVDRYREAFFRDAAEILDDEQNLLLTSYETTELERERQRLQIAINLK